MTVTGDRPKALTATTAYHGNCSRPFYPGPPLLVKRKTWPGMYQVARDPSPSSFYRFVGIGGESTRVDRSSSQQAYVAVGSDSQSLRSKALKPERIMSLDFCFICGTCCNQSTSYRQRSFLISPDTSSKAILIPITLFHSPMYADTGANPSPLPQKIGR